MKRLSNVHFLHSKEEIDDEQLNRMSMCFSIGISEQVLNQGNHYNNNVPLDRGPRKLGGGLFGAAEGGYKHNLISFAVPNKLFAESRSVLGGCDKYCKRSNVGRRKSFMNYDEIAYKQPSHCAKEHYKPESYQRWKSLRKNASRRLNLTESYECPCHYNLDNYQESYIPPNYRQYNERPHRSHYKREQFQNTLDESFPEYGHSTEHSREKNRMAKRRDGRQLIGNNNFYNAFYNTEFPVRSHQTNNSQYDYNDPTYYENNSRHRNVRQASGYTAISYPQNYNEYEYDNQQMNYQPDYNPQWGYNVNTPEPRAQIYYYPRPTFDYDYGFYEDNKIYRVPRHQRKSVEFLPNDCEIPHNVFKREMNHSPVHNSYVYLDRQSRSHRSAVEIPYKLKKRKHFTDYEYDLEHNRSESGSEYGVRKCGFRKKKVYHEPWPPSCPVRSGHSCNPLACSRHSQPVKCAMKSLKQKISGFFKGPKCRSRMQCVRRPSPRYCCQSPRCMDGSKSLSSVSCVVVPGRRIPACPTQSRDCCSPPMRKTRCAVYPTVYRDMCSKRCTEELACGTCISPKVNNSQFERENDGFSKCSSEYSRNRDCTLCQEAQRSQEAACVDAPTCCCAKEDAPSNCSTNNDDELGCNKVASNCCLPENDTATKPSAINVCLRICTTNGNLTQSPTVTATVVEPHKNLHCVSKCQLRSRGTPSTWSSQMGFGSNQEPSPCCCKVHVPALPKSCSCGDIANSNHSMRSNNANSENSFISVRCIQCNTSDTCLKTTSMPKRSLLTAKCDKPKTGCRKPSTISFKDNKICIEACQKKSGESRTCLKKYPCKKSNDTIAADIRKTCQMSANSMSCLKKTGTTESSCKLPKSCVRTSHTVCQKPEPCCNPCCPKVNIDQSDLAKCPPSILEDLKRELLDTLRAEQQIQAQLVFQRPTPHISIFPCVPETQSCHQAEPWKTRWAQI